MKRPHYAWMVCLGSALVLFSTIGLGVNVFTIYQPEIILANGFSNAQGSWITTTRSLFILAALLTVNQLCQRLGLRLVMTLGVVLLSLSYFCFGLATSFFTYCLAAALTGLATAMGAWSPSLWSSAPGSETRRGLALGLLPRAAWGIHYLCPCHHHLDHPTSGPAGRLSVGGGLYPYHRSTGLEADPKHPGRTGVGALSSGGRGRSSAPAQTGPPRDAPVLSAPDPFRPPF